MHLSQFDRSYLCALFLIQEKELQDILLVDEK